MCIQELFAVSCLLIRFLEPWERWVTATDSAGSVTTSSSWVTVTDSAGPDVEPGPDVSSLVPVSADPLLLVQDADVSLLVHATVDTDVTHFRCAFSIIQLFGDGTFLQILLVICCDCLTAVCSSIYVRVVGVESKVIPTSCARGDELCSTVRTCLRTYIVLREARQDLGVVNM